MRKGEAYVYRRRRRGRGRRRRRRRSPTACASAAASARRRVKNECTALFDSVPAPLVRARVVALPARLAQVRAPSLVPMVVVRLRVVVQQVVVRAVAITVHAPLVVLRVGVDQRCLHPARRVGKPQPVRTTVIQISGELKVLK